MTDSSRTDCKAPFAEKRPLEIKQLGRIRHDDYAWLKAENWRDVMSDPSVLPGDIRAHLESENAYMDSMTEETRPLQETLFEEMKGRIKDDDSSVPTPHGPYSYYHRYRPGDQHGVYMRSSRDGANEVEILDADRIAAGHAYFDLGSVSHSPDHKWLAYGVDVKGSEKYQIRFIDLDTGNPLEFVIENSTGGVEWSQDSQTVVWVERDAEQRPASVHRINILDEKDEAEEIFRESNPGFFVGIDVTDAQSYVQISAHNHTSSETWLISDPKGEPVLTAMRRNNIEYDLHEHGDHFYILTNQGGATDFQIMRAPKSCPQAEHWESFIAHRPGRLILGLQTFARHMVWLERENALPRIVIRNMETGAQHAIDFDEQAYALGLSGGYEYDTEWVRFSYSSPTTPRQTFDYNMSTKERVLRKTAQVPSGHNPEDYKTERLSVTARDGAEIPVTLIYKSGLKIDGSAPLLLYGYGSYGITISAGFRTSLLSLVDRGFVYAIAHIRGGMSKGYQWYLDGKLEHKVRTFNDFVDVGDALCRRGYSRQGRVIAHGGSAGGLLVGAAVNQSPELFAGVIAAVPFVDVLNTMSDESLPLTPPEWPEWGNPLIDEDAYDRIAAYCPYSNVSAKDYPPILITAGLTDPRVTYWEPAKWAAKLRDHQTASAPIILKTNMDAGHQGDSGRYDSLKETAFDYAFAIKAAGLALE